MKNNEIIEYKQNFLEKIKNFFKKIFKSKKTENKNIVAIKNNNNENLNTGNNKSSSVQVEKEEFTEELKVNSNTANRVIDKKKLLEQLDGNRETLNMLSVDRLKKLEAYYDEIIEQNEKKIKDLKANQ